MLKTTHIRTNMVLLPSLLGLSSLLMLWLFWRHPITTAITTGAVLAAFGLSARLSRAVEADSAEITAHDQGLPGASG